jgi:cytochrome c-type biogenesis protein CcmH
MSRIAPMRRPLPFCRSDERGIQSQNKDEAAMIGFFLSAGAMAGMVGLVLLQALRRASTSASPAGSEDLIIYRDQLAEVDRDLARGVLPAQEADRLRIEVQRRILEAGRAQPETPNSVRSHPAIAALTVVLALALSGVIYLSLGAPGYPDLPIAARLANADAAYQSRPSQDTLEAGQPAFTPPADADKATLDIINQLRKAVADHPDDLQGQIYLAQNEADLGNYAAARKAQADVIRLKGAQANAEDYATLGIMMFYAAQGIVSPQAEQALTETLQRDPTHPAARFYMGLMAAQVGRPDQTFPLWKALLDEGPDTAPWIPMITERLQDIADAAGIPYQAPDVKGPSAGDMANAAQMSPEERQKMIEGMVGGLESRLMSDGGPIEDWTKLINALGVLNAPDRAKAAYAKAQADFAGQPGELSALKAAATAAGIAP